MGDLFDEFLDELKRRREGATGGDPRRPTTEGPDEDDPDRRPADQDDEAGAADPDADPAADADEPGDEPTPLGAGRRRGRPGRRGASGDGPGRPRSPRRGPGGPDDGARSGIRRRLGLAAAILVIGFLIVMFLVGIELWTDAVWYRSVGFDAVFWTRVGGQLALFAAGFAIALVVFLGNLWLAGRLAPPPDGSGVGGTLRTWIDRLNEAAANAERGGRGSPPWEPWGQRPADRRPGDQVNVSPIDLPDPTGFGRVVIIVVAALAALTAAGTLAGSWETLVLWQNAVPFAADGQAAVTDPIFGRDVSFFLFDLPFQRALQGWLTGLVVVSLVVAGGRYLVAALAGSSVFTTPVRVHLGVLAGLVLVSIAYGYQLDKFELVYSDRGVATGVSFTDATAQFLAYDVLTALSAIAAAFLVGGAFAKVLWPLYITVAVWLIASIGIGRIYPELVQYLTVNPNQFAQEQPYIANNIAMTRQAYGLDAWSERGYRGEAPLTEAAIEEDEATFRNARLWDYRPLGDTLDQLQTVTQYYDFTDVDTDRYPIGDETRQVMLSVRELALENNPNATGWVNTRIFYTHGIGVAMVPVNEVATQGQPRLLISNLPPVSRAGAPEVTEPRIYFGERPSDYIVVGARQDEFDYPRGSSENDVDQPKTRWSGDTGIKLDTVLSRLLFSLRFGDFNLLISDQVTSDSQLLFHRNLGDRLPRIAPFLRYDKDPYVVVDGDGRLKYVQDAFTVSDRFPNAQHFDPRGLNQAGGTRTGLGDDPFNYIRNSVKVVMDAYDGTMTFYVADASDPLIRAWQGVFPSLFRPIGELPADLAPHLRFPEELFNVQTAMFGRYHVTDPLTFFSNDDLWTVPVGSSTENSLPSEAYYVIMSLPEETEPEFLLLQPMIRQNRPNMIAWVAARNDGEDYGDTLVYRFPTETTVFGPAQIEAQIDSDPEISAQFTLWKNSGSDVIRGNLIVVPVGDALIYLQPIYLRSTSARFPAFQKIVVASPTTVVWGDTLREALDALLAEQPGGPGPSPSPGPTPTPGPSPTPGPTSGPGPTPPADDVAALVEYANTHFELAQEALRDGDFARYGEEIALVQQALAQLDALVGEGGTP